MWVAASGVHRMGRIARWQTKALVGVIGATLVGITAGALTAAIGAAVGPSVRAATATVALLVLLALLLIRAPLPQIDRETPQSLLHRGPLVWAATNGGLLGFALTSRLGFWLWYVIPISAFANGSPLAGAAIWGSYGFVRLGTLALVAMKMRSNDDAPSALTAALLKATARVRSVMTSVAIAACLAFVVWIGF